MYTYIYMNSFTYTYLCIDTIEQGGWWHTDKPFDWKLLPQGATGGCDSTQQVSAYMYVYMYEHVCIYKYVHVYIYM